MRRRRESEADHGDERPDWPGGDMTLVARTDRRPVVVTLEVGYRRRPEEGRREVRPGSGTEPP